MSVVFDSKAPYCFFGFCDIIKTEVAQARILKIRKIYILSRHFYNKLRSIFLGLHLSKVGYDMGQWLSLPRS